jgi:hypothetical protein
MDATVDMPQDIKRILRIVFLAAALTVWCVRVFAHHSFSAEFDINRPIEFRGTVVKVELINPHSWIHVEVTDKSGAKTVWMVEGGSPNALFRRGITKTSLPIGAELIVVGYQARDGGNRCVGRTLKLANGESLFLDATPLPTGVK